MTREFWTADIDWQSELFRDDLHRLHAIIFSNNNPDKKLTALDELSEMANAGSLASAIYLASYYDSKATSKTKDIAIKWLNFAGGMGSRAASFREACLRIKYKSDCDKAKTILQKLSNDNYLPAKYKLAVIFIKEDRIKNKNKYIHLLESAAEGGHVFARRDLSILAIKESKNISEWLQGIMMYVSAFVYHISMIFQIARRSPDIEEKIY